MAKAKIREVEEFDDDDEDVEEGGTDSTSGVVATVKYEGEQPLTNPRYESFARRVAQGIAQVTAYKECISRNCSNMTAHTEARRVMKRPEMRARVAYMIKVTNDCEAPTEKRDAITLCNKIIRKQGVPDMVRLQAVDRLAKMFRWYDPPKEVEGDGTPDPAFFVKYVNNMRKGIPSPASTDK